ncbi:MAG: toll/interleukin-1 receptor domain-containing protein [Rivularia sp. (in: cyanobacteria)]
MPSTKTIKVVYFCSDADKDKKLLEELEKHLKHLNRQGIIDTWHKSMIAAGKDITTEINRQLDEANIILPLISSDFIASDDNWNIVAKSAMERHKSRKARVIPVLLRPVEDSWRSAFPNIKALPQNEKPVTNWKPYDNAFMSIAEGIREAVKDINSFPFPIKLPLQQIASGMMSGMVSVFNMAGTAFSSSSRRSKRGSRKKNGSAIAFATPLMIFAVGGIFLPKLSNLVEIPSLQTSQTFVSTQNISPIGWIRVGIADSTSNYLRNSNINSSLVPSKGALVTVDKTIDLWKNVKNSYNSSLPTYSGKLKPNQELIILRVKPLSNPNSNLSDRQIWAQVGRCNQTCGK